MTTPEEQEHVRAFEAFQTLCADRWRAGASEYAGTSYSGSCGMTLAEIEEELADVAVWASIVFAKVRGMARQLAVMENQLESAHHATQAAGERFIVVEELMVHARKLLRGQQGACDAK